MSGDVQNARGDSGIFNGLHGLRESGASAGCGRELGSRRRNEDQKRKQAGDREEHTQNWLCHVSTLDPAKQPHCAASVGDTPNGHSLRKRDCTRKTARPKTITNSPHHIALPVRRKSQTQPAIVSSAGKGYNHILNGRRSGGQRRRKSITPTAWPIN